MGSRGSSGSRSNGGGRGTAGSSKSMGITEDDWMNWAEDPEIFQAALNGDKKPPVVSQADGHSYTKEEWERAKEVAPEIQKQAESTVVDENTLFRGESYDSLLEARRKYKVGATITNNKLTSYTTNSNIASAYAEANIEFSAPGSVKVVITNTNVGKTNGSVGVKTDPFGIGGSAEVVTPKGLKSKVMNTYYDKKSSTLFVSMYNKATPKKRK